MNGSNTLPVDEQPEDKELTSRIHQEHTGEIQTVKAVVPMDMLVPFSEYKPKDTEEFRIMYEQRLKDNNPVPMTVYEKDGKFIVSDDYELYYFYTDSDATEAPCLILGEYTPSESVRPVASE